MKLLIYLIIGTAIQLVYMLMHNADDIVDSVEELLGIISNDPEDEKLRKKGAYRTVYVISVLVINILCWPINILIDLVSIFL